MAKRLPVLLNETEEQKKTRLAEEERLKEQRIARLRKRMARVMNGNAFTGKPLHEAFSSAKVLQRQINVYFSLCEMDKEPLTVPGLALTLGVRTKELLEYDPGPDYLKYKRLVEFAIQRIERYMATELSRGTGSTKGKEFLAQNTLGYANKSMVNAQVDQTITERERLKTLDDEELDERIRSTSRKIRQFAPRLLDQVSGE
jgi:hypothetical protein